MSEVTTRYCDFCHIAWREGNEGACWYCGVNQGEVAAYVIEHGDMDIDTKRHLELSAIALRCANHQAHMLHQLELISQQLSVLNENFRKVGEVFLRRIL